VSNFYSPKKYFTATFVLTTFFWSIGAYYSFRPDSGFYMAFMLIGLTMPFVVALAMLIGKNSRSELRNFLNKLFNIKLIRLKMIPAMLFLIPFSVVVSIFISTFFGGSFNQFQLSEHFSFSTGFVPVLLLLMLAAVFEELGWRGYAFESLAERYSMFSSSIIFSILWSAWHLPLIFVNNSYQYELLNENIWYCINFFWSIVPLGVIVSWFCLRNNKSIISAVIFHFVINISQEALEITQVTKSIQSFVLLIMAIIIIYADRELFFNKAVNNA